MAQRRAVADTPDPDLTINNLERVTASLQQVSSTLRVTGQDYEQVEQTNRMRFTAG